MHVPLNDRYHRVATIAEAGAENSSQAAPHAIVHALWIEGSPDTTMCGRIESLDTKRMPKNRIVSCQHCLAAIKKVRQRNSRDGQAAAAERRSQEAEQAERDAEIAEAKQRQVERDAEAMRQLREICGFVENASEQTVRIFQDDATRAWIVKCGDERMISTMPVKYSTTRTYHGSSLNEAIDTAYRVEKQEF